MADRIILDITGGGLSPDERAIHDRYQAIEPDEPYYDPDPPTDERGERA